MAGWLTFADPMAPENVLGRAAENPTDPASLKPGFFEGAGTALGMSAMKGFARLGQVGAVGLAAPSVLYERATDQEGRHTDPYFRAVDKSVQKALDWWTPDARTTGTAGRVLGGLAETLTPLTAGPAGLIATQQIGTAMDLVRQGVEAKTANEAGAVQALSAAIGLRMPIWGATLAQRAAIGAGGNLALGAGTAKVQREVLTAEGYGKQAQQFDPLDPTARTVDAAAGVVFGWLTRGRVPAGRSAPLVSETDATLAAVNAKHHQHDSAPGEPSNQSAASAHADALDTAIEQLLRGEKVSVPGAVAQADFASRPANADHIGDRRAAIETARQAIAIEGLSGNRALIAQAAHDAGIDPRVALAISSIETGGKFNAGAKNPVSTATGLFQFLDSTWLARGGTEANRLDPVTQAQLGAQLIAENSARLAKSLGREAAPHEVYLAHLLALDGARTVLRADPSRPMIDVVRQYDPRNARQIVENNAMAGLTVGEAIGAWRARVNQHLSRLGFDDAATPTARPTDRASWERDTQSQLTDQLGRGERVGHAREIATLWDQVHSQPKAPAARIRFDVIDEPAGARLAEQTGLDLQGYRVSVDSAPLAKALRADATPTAVTSPLTAADAARIPEIVRNFDSAELAKGPAPTVRLSKQIEDQAYTLELKRNAADRSLVVSDLHKQALEPAAIPDAFVGKPSAADSVDQPGPSTRIEPRESVSPTLEPISKPSANAAVAAIRGDGEAIARQDVAQAARTSIAAQRAEIQPRTDAQPVQAEASTAHDGSAGPPPAMNQVESGVAPIARPIEAAASEVGAARKLIDRLGDVEVPTGLIRPDGTPETISARELMAKLEQELAAEKHDSVRFEAAVRCFLGAGA